jgi:putative sigma-54 modulation protein
VDHEVYRVLETERFPLKPMTLEEAIESMDGGRTALVVFRNAETERVNVVYRRADGNLALIEPEP